MVLMRHRLFHNGILVLPDRLVPGGELLTAGDRIVRVGDGPLADLPPDTERVDLANSYLAPGFVDLHVHGGAGADFMDATADAFRTVCRCHARHGTTSLTPTTTVAPAELLQRVLALCRCFRQEPTGGARVLGAHLYGPYFAPAARGCHPAGPLRWPTAADAAPLLDYADALVTATVAPELPSAEAFVRACQARGIRCNIGHSHATFDQVETAIAWGVRHVDHLFCAMSDRARLRASQPFPMRGGVLEATLYFEELTTEVIADGKHLQRELLLWAYKVKGPDRLALVTDANRAVDMPDGDYWFGPAEVGERIVRRHGVGLMPDGQALASGVVGLDECVRTFHRLTGVPLPEVVRLASLTPARILGLDHEIGSLAPGKRADLVVLDQQLAVQAVYVGGVRLAI